MDKQRYLDLIQPAIAVVVKKHEDYQAGLKLNSYFPFGHKSHVQMLHVKCQRLVSLVKADKEPVNEAVVDSVLDLINYAVFYLDYIEDGKLNE
jgi:hypothetical protein